MPSLGKTMTGLALSAALGIASIQGAAADKLKIGFIYPSPIGDVGWAKELDNGRAAIEEALGDKVETVVVENVPEGPDAARIMNQMVSTGAGMMMIGSFGYMNDGLKLAQQKPDVTFIHASGYKTLDNFGNFQTRNYESAYVAGMAAGFATKSNTLGIVAAYSIPEVVGIINTFTLGAQRTNPDVTVKVVWLNSWFNPSKAQESARSLIAQEAELQGWRPTITEPNMPRPADGYPQDVAEHMRLMADIMVLAFQTDTTRVCSLKLNNDHSSLRFPHLGVDYMIHHLLSHADTPDWLKVNQFFVEQIAYIATKLDAIQEGERTALDNTMLLFCSSMLTGSHDATQLPIILVGRGGETLETGRVLDYREKENRKMCSLYLSLLDKFEIRLPSFGDSNERLAEV